MSNYNDLNTKFKSAQNEENALVMELASIKQGLERLLTTPKGHNPFNREYGSSLYNLLFENNVDIATIQMFLYMDITTWEPRITISPNSINVQKIDNNTYQVDCNFELNNISSVASTIIAKE